MPAEAEAAHFVDLVGINARILRVDMNEVLAKFADRTYVVDVLKHQMRRIEVQAERPIGEFSKELSPDGGANRKVLSARPFVIAKEHRTILDADFHAGFLRVGDDTGPHFAE